MFTPCWKYRTAIFTTLSLLGGFTLATFSSVKVFAQTPPEKSAISQCLGVKIELYIWQLNQGSPSAFNALIACNSKAVPALTRALDSEDDNLRIIAIAALGEIGTHAAPAVPKLTSLFNNISEGEDVCAIAADALSKIQPGNHQTRKCTGSSQGSTSSNQSYVGGGHYRNNSQMERGGVRQTISVYVATKTPIMCNILVVRDVLAWKCPKKVNRSYQKKPKNTSLDTAHPSRLGINSESNNPSPLKRTKSKII
jgi:hypothetical protein